VCDTQTNIKKLEKLKYITELTDRSDIIDDREERMLEEAIYEEIRHMKATERIKYIQRIKTSARRIRWVIYTCIGKRSVSTRIFLNTILDQTDNSKKQYDIVRFAENINFGEPLYSVPVGRISVWFYC
jgi:hypothetical protein